MRTSPSSSAQQARQGIAQRLREIRLDAGLTARAVAQMAGWHESKASKIEHGRTVPSEPDIRAWCTACGAEDQIPELVAASRAADLMYVEWKRLQKTGLRQLQVSKIKMYEQVKHFRVYCSNVIPGLFQTPAYAEALLSSIAAFREAPNDVAQAVAARVARARLLHEGNHRFAVLVEEWVLRSRIGNAEVMAGQLGHLLAVMSLPSVSLGVIPQDAQRLMWPVEAFNIFDDSLVQVELLTAEINVSQPSEIAQYVRGFNHMSELAVYGTAARQLIAAAISELG
ncbi:helix-turn-helix domain-containing protein [Nonomuraea roseoviolacea]|uniref:Transcriptional regulator with XRE-family HTH domain n=1 Tax=Nonomuraea roseoviolacea subsp. carminata TaxID=160689 RepID=A0ABT1K8Y3_9ACTN|nr:helix-turn-helix transcriptional regulator [Nonomuraea roseoviolacea]MCP2350468.1 transcriptional regulator with XRE-family HTH domain [Nonomuraea roseoviolacea subsp. carminata]